MSDRLKAKSNPGLFEAGSPRIASQFRLAGLGEKVIGSLMMTRLLSFLFLVTLVEGAHRYEPRYAVPFEEMWRWNELEVLVDYEPRCVDQSESGVLWFGTNEGVVSYDGFQVEAHPFADSELPAIGVKDIFIDSREIVYALTAEFCGRFQDGVWEKLFSVEDENLPSFNFAESTEGVIWVGTASGLHRIATSGISKVEVKPEAIDSVLVDSRQRLWIADGPTGDLYVYELKDGNVAYLLRRYLGNRRSIVARSSLYLGPTGRVWVIRRVGESDLRCFEGYKERIVIDEVSAYGTGRAGFLDFVELPEGEMYLAGRESMLRFDGRDWVKYGDEDYPLPGVFPFIFAVNENTLILGGREGKSLWIDLSPKRWTTLEGLNFHCEDVRGDQWFIAYDGSVVRQKALTGEWIAYGASDGLISEPNSIVADRDGNIWVSGGHGRVAAVARFDGKSWKREIHEGFSGLIGFPSVYQLEDESILFGSHVPDAALLRNDQSGGLLKYVKAGEDYRIEVLAPPDYPSRIGSLAMRSNGETWIGTLSLCRKPVGGSFEHHEPFGDNYIDHVITDQYDNLWVAIWGKGVHRFDGSGWTRYGTRDGLVSLQVSALMETTGMKGLWAATSEGLSRFDGITWTPHALSPHLKFRREGCSLREGGDGSLWLNFSFRAWNFRTGPLGHEREERFRTIRYAPDYQEPETYLVDYSASVQESGGAFFRWSGIDKWSLTRAQALEYSYRIDQGDWTAFKPARETIFNDLKSGTHQLAVRARDQDWNIDPTPAVVTFRVIPPLWKRPWFVLLSLSVLGIILFLIYLLERTRVKHLLALEEFKIQFFNNVSHELRTPLSVILGPLESSLKETLAPALRNKLQMAYRNARKMKGLVNQLLEFRKVELGKLKYRPVRSDIMNFLNEAVYSHTPLWVKKRQHLEMQTSHRSKVCLFDPDKLQRIIDNLVSNAIKYTPEEGKIRVELWVEDSKFDASGEQLKLIVEDTGIGIPDTKKELIFQTFYRAKPGQRHQQGSGIGLALVKELVDLWQGRITVESPCELSGGNEGTRFTVLLPLRGDKNAPLLEHQDLVEFEEVAALEDLTASPSKEVQADESRPHLLLVEDNADLVLFLKEELIERYRISTAPNGHDGLELARHHMPDLIITDVMMPEMDGMELCRLLKTSPETSHIPVVMLTARSSEDQQLAGLETGADDYLTKPVNLEILRTRVHNLLESRRRLRERFQKQMSIEPKEMTVTSVDEAFLEKALAIVDARMRDPEFDIDAFSREMALSRTAFYRKIKAITGSSPSSFLRSMRMKRAAQLLKTGNLTVSETLEHIGILDQSYFTKLFKKEFGEVPSSFIPNRAKERGRNTRFDN